MKTETNRKDIQYQDLFKELLEAMNELNRQGTNQGYGTNNLLEKMENRLDKFFGESSTKQMCQLNDIIGAYMEELEMLSELNGPGGLSTGFIDFDNITSGLQKSDLIILGGRPNMGKTAFALNIAGYLSSKKKHPESVLWFSSCIPKVKLTKSLLASTAKIDIQRLLSGRLEVEDWDNLAITIDTLSKAPFYIHDNPEVTIQQIIQEARELKTKLKNGLSLLVVDYIQLVQSSDSNHNLEQKIEEVTFELKKLAKELDIPIIAISQVNRKAENRLDKRPWISELRGSPSIEEIADVVIFIYRDEIYWDDSKKKGLAEIIIAKNLQGPIGTVELAFIGKYQKYANYTFRDDLCIDDIPF